MQIDELKGHKIKKDIEAETVRKEYHNKHKDGSGNFGFSIKYPENNTLYRLDGEYNRDGRIYYLDYGKYSGVGTKINCDTYESMIRDINFMSIKTVNVEI